MSIFTATVSVSPMSLLPGRPSLFSRARSNCDLAPREAPQYAELSAQDGRATLSHLSFRARSRNLLLFKSRDVSTALDMTKVVWRFKIDRKSTRLNSSHEWISYA